MQRKMPCNPPDRAWHEQAIKTLEALIGGDCSRFDVSWHHLCNGDGCANARNIKPQPKTISMKLIRTLTLAILATGLTLSAVSCKEEKGPMGKLGDKIDDATDSRPGEKIRDAVEDITK